MYAIIETGGKQYKVSPGKIIRVEKIEGERGTGCVLDKVLVISDGESAKVGKPYIPGATVEGKIVRQGRARKILGFKYKPKTNYRKRYGHRQYFTEIRIESINHDAEGTVTA
ncbi:MAG: 50S ribosomal protein L21 [Bacillota bacterium]|nr:50S ribosomal protein L21 [Candidatus Fermentithermobacillaceae bacterium]